VAAAPPLRVDGCAGVAACRRRAGGACANSKSMVLADELLRIPDGGSPRLGVARQGDRPLVAGYSRILVERRTRQYSVDTGRCLVTALVGVGGCWLLLTALLWDGRYSVAGYGCFRAFSAVGPGYLGRWARARLQCSSRALGTLSRTRALSAVFGERCRLPGWWLLVAACGAALGMRAALAALARVSTCGDRRGLVVGRWGCCTFFYRLCPGSRLWLRTTRRFVPDTWASLFLRNQGLYRRFQMRRE
jgi:hypothetical protein